MAIAAAVHEGIVCDGKECGQCPLRGIRWRCKTSPDYDLCDLCKKKTTASTNHGFEIISLTNTMRARYGARYARMEQHEMILLGQIIDILEDTQARNARDATALVPNLEILELG